jgi:hypothetical protein
VALLQHDDIFARREVRDVSQKSIFTSCDVLQDRGKVRLRIDRFQAGQFRENAMKLLFR